MANDPNIQEPGSFTLDELKAAGIDMDQLIQAQVKIKELQSKGRTLDEIAPALERLITTQQEIADAQKTLAAEMQAKAQSDAFDAATKDAFVQRFKAIKDTDPEKAKSIASALGATYGDANAELVLKGSELRKALERPIHKASKSAAELNLLRDAWDDAYMLSAMWGGNTPSARHADTTNIDWPLMLDAAKKLEEQGREGMDLCIKAINEAMDTQTTNQGTEWLPTMMSGNLADEVYLSLRVASLFPRIPMPSKNYDVPMRISRSLGYRMPEATTNTQFFTNLATANSMNTSKFTLSAQKLATLNFLSDELDEDSILPILALMREDVIYGLNYCIEDAVVNGSTGATLDGALWTGTTDARSAWNGLRTGAQASSTTTDLSTFSLTALRNLRKPMVKYSVDPADLSYILAPQTHINILTFPEVLTMEKYGANATVVTGEIGRIDNIPIIISPVMYTNLNASGVYDGITTTKTNMLLLNRKGYVFGDRRMVRVESERQALAGQRFVLVTWRGDFKKQFPSAEPLVAQGINMAI